ncbi:MAG: PAS domain S-box protein [Promethearchaeota archaeon]
MVDDYILIIDSKYNFKILDLNEPVFLKNLGYFYKDLFNQSFLNLVHEKNIKQLVKILKKPADYPKTKQTILIKPKQGEYIPVDIRVKPFYGDFKDKKLMVLLRNAQTRLHNQELLREKKDQIKRLNEFLSEFRLLKLFTSKKVNNAFEEAYNLLKLIIESIPQMIFWKDYNLNYLGCNMNYIKYLNLSTPEELLDKTDKEIILNQNLLKTIEKAEKKVIMLNQPEFQVEEMRINQDGTNLWLNVNRVPLRNKKGKVIGLVVTYDDITSKKQIEINLKNSELKIKESEMKYRSLFEHSPFLIIILDLNGTVIDTNNRGLEKLEISKEELIGNNFQDFEYRNPFIKSLFIENFIKLKKNGKIEISEHSIPTREGETLWFFLKGSVINLNNEPFYQVIIQDITERKLIELKLRKSEQNYRNLIESSKDGIVWTTLEGQILDCNQSFLDMLEYSKEEIKNLTYQEITPEKWHEWEKKIIEEQIWKKGYADEYEKEYIRKDGSLIQTSHLSWLLKDENNKPVGIWQLVRDVSDKIIAEKKLRESEIKYKMLFQKSPFSIILTDFQGKVIDCNSQFENLLGYTREVIIEESPHLFTKIFLTKKDLKFFLNTVFKEKEVENFELDVRKKDHSIITIIINANFIDLEGEKLIQFIFYDNTLRKHYEQLILRLNHNFLNFTVNTQQNIVNLLSTCKELLNANKIIYSFKNFNKPDEIIHIITEEGESYQISSKDYLNNYLCADIANIKIDIPQIYLNLHETDFAKRDPFIKKHNYKGCFGRSIKSLDKYESVIAVFFKKNPLMMHEDQMVLTLISDAIEVERQRWEIKYQLEQQNKALNEINKVKTDLLTRTSHELKTPLIAIRGFTDLLINLHEKNLDQQTNSILNEIREGSKRLEKIINSLLTTSKIEQGYLELKLEKTNINVLIQQCVKDLDGLLKLRNQTVILDLHQEIIINIDKLRIYEVLTNLLMNAIKYSEKNSIIIIKLKGSDEEIVISIKDEGIGFTEEEKNNIFTPFGKIERYGQGLDIETEGSGLGLYISKEIIELHKGKIWVKSKGRSKGSKFFISIPFHRKEDEIEI